MFDSLEYQIWTSMLFRAPALHFGRMNLNHLLRKKLVEMAMLCWMRSALNMTVAQPGCWGWPCVTPHGARTPSPSSTRCGFGIIWWRWHPMLYGAWDGWLAEPVPYRCAGFLLGRSWLARGAWRLLVLVLDRVEIRWKPCRNPRSIYIVWHGGY